MSKFICKVYCVRDSSGFLIRAFKDRKKAMKYAEENGWSDWHREEHETDGVYGVDLYE